MLLSSCKTMDGAINLRSSKAMADWKKRGEDRNNKI